MQCLQREQFSEHRAQGLKEQFTHKWKIYNYLLILVLFHTHMTHFVSLMCTHSVQILKVYLIFLFADKIILILILSVVRVRFHGCFLK